MRINKYGLEKGMGSIYLDKSYKGMRWGKPIRHNTYRAEVSYDGIRYRKRSKNPFLLASWLMSMKEQYAETGTVIRSAKIWDDWEIATLKDLCKKESAKEIAFVLDRTVSSVREKARELGVRLVEKNKKPTQRKARRVWTDEEVAVLVERYPDEPTEDIAKDLQMPVRSVYAKALSLGIKKSEQYRTSPESGMFLKKQRRSMETEFQKGHTPWNKGKKMPFNENRVKTQFKAGNRPHNSRSVGETRTTRDGYIEVKVLEPNVWRPAHTVLWAKHYGRVPKGHIVVFRDGNRSNITIENLECISRGENMKRNFFYKYPKEIIQLHHLKGALTRAIKRKERENNE